jgi:cytochrome c peroxidase
MGMMAEEFVWRLPAEAGADPDGDGLERELTVGDITAMTMHNALQETPDTLERLAAAGLVAAPDAAATARVARGRELFARIGCASCHRPELHLASTVFEEPTRRGNGHYLDGFLAAKSPDYDPARPVRADLATAAPAPRVEPASPGGATLRLYGDLKRHDMGRTMAEPAGGQASNRADLAPLERDGQKVIVPASVFLTAELWGVGNTGPWLHDGRAGTLAEAIAFHGEDAPPQPGGPGRSEAQEARDAFLALAAEERGALVAFLKSLVTFSPND